MGSDPRVRSATASDVPAIQQVARRTWHAAYDDVLGAAAVDEQVDEWYAREVVADAVEDAGTVYLVATLEDDVVGYTSAGPAGDGHDGATARLFTIYVLPDRWSDGIGSELIDAVTDALSRRGFDRLRIPVLAANDVARSFYEREGFELVRRGTVELAGREVTEVVYAGAI